MFVLLSTIGTVDSIEGTPYYRVTVHQIKLFEWKVSMECFNSRAIRIIRIGQPLTSSAQIGLSQKAYADPMQGLDSSSMFATKLPAWTP